jgi:prepilin-type N-terminal cleavage/methylation domain-containing protein
MSLSKKINKNSPIAGGGGFTLIELLLVVAILSILLVVVFAALNPAKRLIDTRNAARWTAVSQVLTALHECIIDEDVTTCGLSSPTLALSQIGSCGSGGATLCTGAADACLDLDADTDLDSYIASFPLDPSDGTAATTGYSVQVTNGIVTIAACNPEDPGSGAPTISVSR